MGGGKKDKAPVEGEASEMLESPVAELDKVQIDIQKSSYFSANHYKN